jgi:hypothetical protein
MREEPSRRQPNVLGPKIALDRTNTERGFGPCHAFVCSLVVRIPVDWRVDPSVPHEAVFSVVHEQSVDLKIPGTVPVLRTHW